GSTNTDPPEPDYTVKPRGQDTSFPIKSVGDAVNQAALGVTLWTMGKNFANYANSTVSRSFGKDATPKEYTEANQGITTAFKIATDAISGFNESLQSSFGNIVKLYDEQYDKVHPTGVIADDERPA